MSVCVVCVWVVAQRRKGGEERGGWSWEVEGLKGQGICLCGYTTSSNKNFLDLVPDQGAQSCNLFLVAEFLVNNFVGKVLVGGEKGAATES